MGSTGSICNRDVPFEMLPLTPSGIRGRKVDAKNLTRLAVTGTRGFLPVWLAWVTAGETLGFLAPVITHLLASSFVPDAVLPLLVGAGAVEGAVLGWAQMQALRHRVPLLSGSGGSS